MTAHAFLHLCKSKPEMCLLKSMERGLGREGNEKSFLHLYTQSSAGMISITGWRGPPHHIWGCHSWQPSTDLEEGRYLERGSWMRKGGLYTFGTSCTSGSMSKAFRDTVEITGIWAWELMDTACLPLLDAAWKCITGQWDRVFGVMLAEGFKLKEYDWNGKWSLNAWQGWSSIIDSTCSCHTYIQITLSTPHLHLL